MATPLTDSINALTTYANEVTGASDTTLSDAVHTLASGYGGGSDEGDWRNATKWMDVISIPQSAGLLPETIIIDGSNLSSKEWFGLPRAWATDLGYRHIIVKNSDKNPITLRNVFQNYYPPRSGACTCTFEDGVKLADVANAMEYVGYNSNKPYPYFYGQIDLSNLTDGKNFRFTVVADHIEFKPNSCSLLTAFDLNNSSMNATFAEADDETIISIGNALKDGISGTLTLPSSGLSRLNSINGYADDTSYDYNYFVADPNGTMTLADFITTVKGWTLA